MVQIQVPLLKHEFLLPQLLPELDSILCPNIQRTIILIRRRHRKKCDSETITALLFESGEINPTYSNRTVTQSFSKIVYLRI